MAGAGNPNMQQMQQMGANIPQAGATPVGYDGATFASRVK